MLLPKCWERWRAPGRDGAGSCFGTCPWMAEAALLQVCAALSSRNELCSSAWSAAEEAAFKALWRFVQVDSKSCTRHNSFLPSSLKNILTILSPKITLREHDLGGKDERPGVRKCHMHCLHFLPGCITQMTFRFRPHTIFFLLESCVVHGRG